MSDKRILILHHPWGKSLEDLYLDGKEYEAEQKRRKELEEGFHKSLVENFKKIQRRK